jgi:hypothetical protein
MVKDAWRFEKKTRQIVLWRQWMLKSN